MHRQPHEKPKKTQTPPPKPKKVRRNPHARALASGLFRNRVGAKGPGVYRRRPKHQKPVVANEET